jgi:hypothetical protein
MCGVYGDHGILPYSFVYYQCVPFSDNSEYMLCSTERWVIYYLFLFTYIGTNIEVIGWMYVDNKNICCCCMSISISCLCLIFILGVECCVLDAHSVLEWEIPHLVTCCPGNTTYPYAYTSRYSTTYLPIHILVVAVYIKYIYYYIMCILYYCCDI